MPSAPGLPLARASLMDSITNQQTCALWKKLVSGDHDTSLNCRSISAFNSSNSSRGRFFLMMCFWIA